MLKTSKNYAKIKVSLTFDAMCAKKSAAHARNALVNALSCPDDLRASYEASALFMQRQAARSAADAMNARLALI